MERTTQQLPEEVEKLLPRLQNPDYTKVLIVTLPELAPVTEAKHLESDLKRTGIHPYAWIINQSLAPLTLSDPLLSTKQQEELSHISKLMDEYSPNVFLFGWDALQDKRG